jgi:hypothetical protein
VAESSLYFPCRRLFARQAQDGNVTRINPQFSILTQPNIVSEDSLFIANVLMKYSVSDSDTSTFLGVLCVSARLLISEQSFRTKLHERFQTSYYKLSTQNGVPPQTNNNIQHSSHLELTHRCTTISHLSSFKAQTVHQLLQRDNTTLLVMEVKNNSLAQYTKTLNSVLVDLHIGPT